jgi:hypothetical protein
VSAAFSVVAEVARRLVGGTIDVGDIVEQVKAEIKEDAQAFEDRVEAKLRAAFEAVGLLLAADAMVDGAERVLDAFEPKGDIKPLGLPITELGPGEEFPVDTVVAEVPEPDQ